MDMAMTIPFAHHQHISTAEKDVEPHPSDVHELLRPHIVCMDDESTIVLIQQGAQLGIILQTVDSL